MADCYAGFEDGLVDDALHRACRVDDEAKPRRGDGNRGPDIGCAPAGDHDFGFGKQSSCPRVVEALQRLAIQQAADGIEPAQDLIGQDVLRARRLHGKEDCRTAHGI